MSKFLSLEWFKSKVEQTVETVISRKIERLMDDGDEQEAYVKPYLNIKLVNDMLTVVLTDGSVLSKQNATSTDFAAIKSAKSEDDIFAIVACPQVVADNLEKKKEINRITALQKGLSVLKPLPDFTVEDNSVYLTGTSRSMPQLLVEKFIEVVDRLSMKPSLLSFHDQLNQDDEYLSLKRFFLWCCLNPRAEVADELYRFLQENSFRITKQGFFVALRNVVTLHGGKEIVDFVTNSYNKVKAVWKKSPNNYTVFLQNAAYKMVHESELYTNETITCPECDGNGKYWDEYDERYVICDGCDGEGTISGPVEVNHGTRIGNLTDLYLNLPNMAENRYTDDWTKTFDIRIGQVVSMPKEECNWSTQDCAAAGLN